MVEEHEIIGMMRSACGTVTLSHPHEATLPGKMHSSGGAPFSFFSSNVTAFGVAASSFRASEGAGAAASSFGASAGAGAAASSFFSPGVVSVTALAI